MKLRFSSVFRLDENDLLGITKSFSISAVSEKEMIIDKNVLEQINQKLEWQNNKIIEQDKRYESLSKELSEIKGMLEAKPGNSLFSMQRKENTHNKPPKQQTPDTKTVQVIADHSSDILNDDKRQVRPIADGWDEILSSIRTVTYRKKYRIGNYKAIDLGREGVINMQIAGFDSEELSDGRGKASVTWISMNGLKTKMFMNPAYERGVTGTGGIGGWKNSKMREYLNTEILSLLSPVIQKI